MSDTPVQDKRICAVDLGINSDAVCSIMRADGTILARKFINFASEKDHLWHTLNKIKKRQRKNGSKSVTKIWEYAKRCNNEHAIKVAQAITDFAVLYSFRGKRGKGTKKQRLTMWRKIGARYFIRELLKPLPVKVRSRIQANIPECEKRTRCTLSTLISLNVELSNLRVA